MFDDLGWVVYSYRVGGDVFGDYIVCIDLYMFFSVYISYYYGVGVNMGFIFDNYWFDI